MPLVLPDITGEKKPWQDLVIVKNTTFYSIKRGPEQADMSRKHNLAKFIQHDGRFIFGVKPKLLNGKFPGRRLHEADVYQSFNGELYLVQGEEKTYCWFELIGLVELEQACQKLT